MQEQNSGSSQLTCVSVWPKIASVGLSLPSPRYITRYLHYTEIYIIFCPSANFLFSNFITKKERKREKCSLAQRLYTPDPSLQSDTSLSDIPPPPLAEGFERTAVMSFIKGKKSKKKKKELQKRNTEIHIFVIVVSVRNLGLFTPPSLAPPTPPPALTVTSSVLPCCSKEK